MKNVIIEIRGGVIQNVAVDGEDIRVAIIDWDDIDSTSNTETQIGWMPSELTRHLAPETQQLLDRLWNA